MRFELSRVAPLSAANIVGALHLIMFASLSLMLAPFLSWVPTGPALEPEQQESLKSYFLWMLLAYPVLGGCGGWTLALIGAAIYNAVARRLGGLVLELLDESPSSSGSAA